MGSLLLNTPDTPYFPVPPSTLVPISSGARCDGRLAASAVPNILQLPRLRVARLLLRITDLPRKHWQLPTAVPPDHRRRQESGHTLRSLHSTEAVDERALNVDGLHE